MGQQTRTPDPPRASYLWQMTVATAFVVLLPMVGVWWLRDAGVLTSFWPCLAVSIAATLLASVIGAGTWKRQHTSGDILFAELLIWGWLRRRRIERHLHNARELLDQGVSNTEHRKRLLRRVAAALDAEDPYLHGHSRRVARYATLTARRMGLSGADVALVQDAAILHDIGKLNVDRWLLQKPGRLTEAEWELMKRHPAEGARLIGADLPVAEIVRHHHSRFDGSGYPDGLAGEMIPLGARIVTVCDSFDAIVSPRPYRAASPHKRGLDVLRADSGTHFDPAVVRAFIAVYNDRRSAVMVTSVAELLAHLRITASSTAGYVLAALVAAVTATTLSAGVTPALHAPPKGVSISTGNPHPPGGLPRGSGAAPLPRTQRYTHRHPTSCAPGL